MGKKKLDKMFFVLLFSLPTFILFALFTLYPMAKGLYMSFFDWSGASASKTFIGLDNYKTMLQDPVIPMTVGHDFFLVFWKVILITSIATFFAVALTRLNLKEKGFWRVVYFIPNIISVVIIGILWMFIYNPEFGLVNGVLKSIGLESWAKPWLGDYNWALASLVPPSVWAGTGFYMILIMAGILNIPTSLYEAAKIDGANEWQQFTKVTLPLVWEQIKLSILSIVMTTLNGSYVIVQLMTQGGPDNSTHVMGSYLYQQGFTLYHFGYGAAIGVLILIVSFVITLILNKLLNREVYEM